MISAIASVRWTHCGDWSLSGGMKVELTMSDLIYVMRCWSRLAERVGCGRDLTGVKEAEMLEQCLIGGLRLSEGGVGAPEQRYWGTFPRSQTKTHILSTANSDGQRPSSSGDPSSLL